MPKNHQQAGASTSPSTLAHMPVLLESVLDCLKPRAGESYLDLTAGYGGHAHHVVAATKAPQSAVLVDRDAQAISALKKRFAHEPVKLIHQDFLAASRQLASSGQSFDMILADLGVSSPHFEKAGRGFSARTPGPLDMRMDQRQNLTASDIVNGFSQQQLAEVLSRYGQEPKARQIAKLIVSARPLSSTEDLANIARKVWPSGSRVHPATRMFQAIRIAVNDELNQLERSLPLWLELLAPGGRLTVISFHSLEDRLVKNFLAENSKGYDAQLELLTKKPIVARTNELVSNPRARSAKLRAGRKNKNKNRKE